MPSAPIDGINRKILAALQEDGRLTLAELSPRVGLSPSPCLRRIRQMESDGLIDRYVAVLNPERVGLKVSVFILIKMTSQSEDELTRFAAAVSGWPEVLECYLTTGPRDYLLRVVVEDLAGYQKFLRDKLTRQKGIASIETSFALEQVKYTNVLPIP